MPKETNNLFAVILFSIIWIIRPISYDEMRSRHTIDSQETQHVIKNKQIFSFKRKCTTLEDFFFSKPDELELLEKSDQIILPRIITSSIDSIEEVKVISYKKDDNTYVKTKTRLGTNSIFVEGFKAIRTSPARPNFNYYDQVEKRIIKPSLMLQAHLTCIKEVEKLPRQIIKKDKTVKFDKNYSGLFKKNYEVFGYNLYLEENLSKTASNNKIKQGKQKLFKKYGQAWI